VKGSNKGSYEIYTRRVKFNSNNKNNRWGYWVNPAVYDMAKDTLEEFSQFIKKYKYEDILRDRTDEEVRQEFNEIHKMLVMLYQCDFAIPPLGDMIHIVNLKLIK